jgi:DNA-binding MurR/RpiR family transcriptional regulator
MIMLRQRISDRINEFSPSQEKIASYILENPRDAAFFTASEFAEKLGISEATIIRFAVALGYDGYPDMKEAMREMVRDQFSTLERISEYLHPTQSDELLERVIGIDMRSMKDAILEVDKNVLEESAKAIMKARKVYVLGRRSAGHLAGYLAFYLGWFCNNIFHLSNEIPYEEFVGKCDDCLLIVLSFPRYSRETIDILQFAKARGANTLAITDSLISPLSENADHVINVPVSRVSIIDSLVTPMSVINALILTMVSMMDEKKVMERLRKLEKIWEEENIYSSNQGQSGSEKPLVSRFITDQRDH